MNSTLSQLKRSQAMEDAALRSILDLFTVQWEITSQKSSKEVMAQVLGLIVGACVTEDKKEPSQESIQLQNANQYLESIRVELEKGNAVPFPLSGNNLPDTINNLVTIRAAASKEPNSKDIQKRLDLFIGRLSELQNQAMNKKRILLVISVIIGAIITWILFSELVTEYGGAAYNLLAVMGFVLFSGAAYFITQRFF